MSNHFSADYLKSPGDDRRLDLTDVFLFKSSKDPSKLVLIMDSNPTVPDPAPNPDRGPEFYPGAVYRINIDTDGDALADVAFTFTFSDYEDGSQTGTAWYATGDQARQPEPAGERLTTSFPVSFDGTVQPLQAGPARLFAGRRSDPFFADLEGTVHQLPVDRARPLRRQQRVHHRTRGRHRSVRHRPADRRLGLHQSARRRRHPGADGPRREPHHQPVHQPRRRERPLTRCLRSTCIATYR